MGIAGFADDYGGLRVTNEGHYGIAAGNGVFYPSNGVPIRKITDSTTYTLLAREQSGTIVENGQDVDRRSDSWAGGWYGIRGDRYAGVYDCTGPPNRLHKTWDDFMPVTGPA